MAIQKPPKDHYCSQEEVINRISKILVGNGNPEDGFVYRVLQMASDQKHIAEVLSQMTKNLEQIQVNNEGLLEEITQVRGSLETFKATMQGRDDAMKAGDEKARSLTTRNIQIIGVIIAFLVLGSGMYFGFKKLSTEQQNLRAQVNYINTPVLNERTGKYELYPTGVLVDSLRKVENENKN